MTARLFPRLIENSNSNMIDRLLAPKPLSTHGPCRAMKRDMYVTYGPIGTEGFPHRSDAEEGMGGRRDLTAPTKLAAQTRTDMRGVKRPTQADKTARRFVRRPFFLLSLLFDGPNGPVTSWYDVTSWLVPSTCAQQRAPRARPRTLDTRAVFCLKMPRTHDAFVHITKKNGRRTDPKTI